MTNFKDLNYDSVEIAKALRYVGQNNGYQFNQTQLNKLLYIAYGTLLVKKNERLTKERPSAWPYGPVFPRLQKNLKLSDPITSSEYDMLNPYIKSILDSVVYTFGGFSATTLSNWSHELGSPWDKAIKRSEGKWNEKLDDDDIYNYFYSLVKV